MTEKAKKVRKEILSWVLTLAIFGFLYITGLHRQIAAGLQRVVVATGIIRPETDLVLDNKPQVDYNFTLKSRTGENVSFEDLKGKVIFMNLWATWCAPCLAEMSDIHDLYQSVDSSKVAFVMISRDDRFGRAKQYVDKKEYTFPIYQLNGPLPEVFSTKSIPTTYVISKNGKIAVKKTGFATYNTEEFKNYLITLADS
ncbi:TlpA disulfide reductase family protein [Fulvivirgaceae bacterium BMA12]|uniref:TlpA disulfide reductase family protein n=1 Tax=Agaribacillus aureus TaxID=3051825 RepID=A0ABT8L972_9BACT|nr:TlpA disulfide reductase family protein [Fulvivirgaceae bacterium BMA12]